MEISRKYDLSDNANALNVFVSYTNKSSRHRCPPILCFGARLSPASYRCRTNPLNDGSHKTPPSVAAAAAA